MKINILCIVLILIAFKIEAQAIQLIPYQDNDKWGFVDSDMNIIVAPKYDSVSVFYNKRSVVKIDKKYGVIDQKGKYIIKPKVRRGIKNFGWYGILAINKKGKYLCFNEDGKRIKELGVGSYCGNGLPQYLEADEYSISNGDKIALIFNKVRSGKNIEPIYIKDTTEFKYLTIESFGPRSFVVRDSLGAGIWAPDELYIKVSNRHENIEVTKGIFQNKYVHKYKEEGKIGLMDIYGNLITEAKYHSIWLDNSGRRIDSLIKVEYDSNKFGYINNTGVEYF